MSKVTFFLAPVCSALLIGQLARAESPFLLHSLRDLDTLTSTIPSNGDVNPYGVAIVPVTTGKLVAGNVLVSNFNNSANLQGTGTTIVQISPNGVPSLFTQITASALASAGMCPGGVGLTTALVVLHSGFVIVGSLPTADGTSATAKAGCLIVLNSNGVPVSTIYGNGINGPWDMTAVENQLQAVLFVTNVLNGTMAANGAVVKQGSVLRIVLSTPASGTPAVMSMATIASAFEERTDPVALVIGPTGLALGADGTLFVADTLRNRIASIPYALNRQDDAGDGFTVTENHKLNQPLGLAIAPDGHILTVNGGDGLIVETLPDGKQNASRSIDVSHSGNGAGTLFGLAIKPDGSAIYFVDDGNNTFNVLD